MSIGAMNQRARTALTAGLLAFAAFSLYGRHLDSSPVYLATDEVTIALTAHSIATTGQDLMGRSWPLYIQMSAGSWFCPVVVYSLALLLKVLPFSEFAIRLPTVCFGVASIVLMYFVGRRLFKSEALAILAAVLLALTPAHFLHSRFALEYIYPLPFLMAWLLALISYLDSDDPRRLFAGTVFLGLGFYSYIASVFLMPIYLGLTWLALLLARKPVRHYAVAVAGFIIPLLVLFVPWLILHRSAPSSTLGHYLIYDSSRLNFLQGMREFFGYTSIAARTSLYWGYLNPSFLFLDATSNFMFSTRTTGVFLLPLAVFAPVGMYQAFRSGEARQTVLLLGFLTAPLAAVLVEEPFSINRALELLPFAVLLAVGGVRHLWASALRFRFRRELFLGAGAAALTIGVGYAAWTLVTQGRISGSILPLVLIGVVFGVAGTVSERAAYRTLVVAGLLIVPVQFWGYAHDYFTEYRSRASETFRGNRRGGLEYIIERDRVQNTPAVYLSGEIEGIEAYLNLYLVKHHRQDLRSRTVIYGGATHMDIRTMPHGSAVMVIAGDPGTEALRQAGELTLETVITDPSGRPAFAIFRH
jgi:4-amino-4-deoxy-L-arabinose transferase-like glycosyltransferase